MILPLALVGVLSLLPTVFSSELDPGTFNFNDNISFSPRFNRSHILVNVTDLATNKTETFNAILNRRVLGITDGPAGCTCSKDSWGKIEKMALGIGLMLIVMPLVLLAVFVHLRKAMDDRVLGETLRNLPGMPREYRYRELSRATGNFAEESKVGEGGFGKVYRGFLPSNGEDVAVKSFSKETSPGDFLSELTVINRLSHKNLVKLLGWCFKNKKLLLVYEYMPNGSLDKLLHHTNNDKTLPWESRYNILRGVASALHYLHHDNDQKVIHSDIKPSNIMLDLCFDARLGDFGLARVIDEEKTSYQKTSYVHGTKGYIAPECFETGKTTAKSDIFGFGVVVLEVVCGRRPGTGQLVDWVWKMHEEGKLLDTVDLRLRGKYDREEGMRLLLLGLACCHPTAGERPKVKTIVEVLSKSLPPPLPNPAFIRPALMEREQPIRNDEITGVDLYSSIIHVNTLYLSLSSSGFHSSQHV